MSALTTLLLTFAVVGGAPRGEVLDFTSRSCGPCQQMSPLVSRLEREGLPIRKVDVESVDGRALVRQFNIDVIPAFVLVVDGREVTRTTGLQSEANLRRMLDRIPDGPSPEDVVSIEPPRRSLPTPAGPTESPRDEPPKSRADIERAVVESELGTPAEPRGVRDWLDRVNPLRPRPSTAGTIARGNDSDLPAAGSPAGADDSIAASARIRVTIKGRINLGSGSVIESRPGRTLLVTCGHIFHEMDDSTKVEVDLFQGATHRTYVGRVEQHDEAADVGIVVIPTETAVATAPIARSEQAPKLGERVACIGCSGGDHPTREQLSVTAINKYEGPDNIECTGIPVQGRSGGGLFNERGEIIGVCIAADTRTQRGLYAHVFAIHALLDACRLTHLYQPPAAVAALEQVPGDPPAEAATNVDLGAAAPPRTAAAMPSPRGESPVADIAAGDAEVVVIIRPRNQPQGASRVVIINQASPKFYAYLNGEMQAQPEPTQAQRVQPTSQTMNVPPLFDELRSRSTDVPEWAADGVAAPLRSETRAAKTSLRPTGLSQPAPRRYVRSRATAGGTSVRRADGA
jgi:S1-C subfamily serine protease